MTPSTSVRIGSVARLRAIAPSLVGILLAAVVLVWFYLSGAATATDDALQVMGFDPDRARLLSALMSAAMAAAISALAGAPVAMGVLAGLIAGGLRFGHTALVETKGALASTRIEGTFDQIGWALSLVTLIASFCVVAWASAVLAREVRRPVIDSLVTLRNRLRGAGGTRSRMRLARAAGVLGSVAIVIGVLPIFGDMVNIAPDVHMRQDPAGAPSAMHLPSGTLPSVSPGTVASGEPGSTASPSTTSGYPVGLVAGPVPQSLIVPGAVSEARPWSSNLPVGNGRVMTVSLPAPWTGGSDSMVAVDIYLPPGYDSGSEKYPVIYTAPESLHYWNRGMRLRTVLDSMITGGAIPPVIAIFASSYGGPYADSECADSVDGREWYDRFVATDLVAWVDANLRTIARPAARATLGFSQGAYCAGAIVAHHPDVFGSAMTLSGYFVSGMHSGTTPNAWRPFNNDPAAMAAVSPMTVVPRISATLRAGLFYALVADPNNPVYGAQMKQFAAVLHDSGVAFAVLPTPLGHSWRAARELVPTLLQLIAGRMVALGVFGPPG